MVEAVIAGAPKCGTSTLFGWLAAHPEVLGSTPKETFFLVDRGHPFFHPARNVHDHGVARYAGCFPGAAEKPGARVRLEATTHYLYQRTPPKVLAALDPVPHVFFVLRKPSERVYSSFRYSQHNLGQIRAEATFRDFVALSEGAEASRVTDPRWGGKVEIWKKDVAYSRYAEWLARWAEDFPRERMHVLLFEEMAADPRAFVRKMAGVLGIDPAFYDTYAFPRRNESYRVRSRALQRWAQRVGTLVPSGPVRALLRGGYRRAMTSAQPRGGRSPEDVETLRALDAAFAPHDARLAREWGLDLSAWR